MLFYIFVQDFNIEEWGERIKIYYTDNHTGF